MKLNDLVIVGVAAATAVGCTSAKNEYASFELYPVPSGSLTEMEYTPQTTRFSLWAPTADEVRLMLYEEGEGGHAYRTVSMEAGEEGVWHAAVDEDLMGRFYTFNVKIDDRWLGDTPGINARAVGVNGKRAAIIDLRATDPEGWSEDRRPPLQSPADAVIYEMHHRDFRLRRASPIRVNFWLSPRKAPALPKDCQRASTTCVSWVSPMFTCFPPTIMLPWMRRGSMKTNTTGGTTL